MLENLTQVKKRIVKAICLAERIQNEANHYETSQDREIAKLVQDPEGKALAVELTDQSFRSSNLSRSANQMRYLIQKHGIPSFLSPLEKAGVWLLKFFPSLVKKVIDQKTAHVIIVEKRLQEHLKKRKEMNIFINLNRLGEAILGEEEAARRLATYLADLENPDIETISVKVSTLYSQINLLDWENSLSILRERYKRLLIGPKFINLDMEEYKDSA